MSLRRTRADWPIVAAAALITLLAATLLAAGPIYASAAAEAGLRRSLADAPAADANVRVSLYAPVADAERLDAAVSGQLGALVDPVGGMVVRGWRGSETLALPGPDAERATDQALVGYLDDLSQRATLIAGAWPSATGPDATAPVDVAVLDTVATDLGLSPGDDVTFVLHPSSNPVEVRARLAGVFELKAPVGPFWDADEQLLTGITDNVSYRILGPFLAGSPAALERLAVSQLQMQWTTYAGYERLTAEQAGTLRSQLRGLDLRLRTEANVPLQVATDLPGMLDDAERSLLVSRTGVLLLMAQLGVLAAYAIVLTASLLVEHRRIDTALLRSRGANSREVALLAAAEGLLIAVPAVLVAPWLAVAALDGLNVAGPLADAGLGIAPRVSLDAYLAAGAAGLVAVVLLVVPALLAARAFAAERGGLSRHLTRTIGQRLGLDVALVAITAIALWQLRLYGAPLTRTVQGTLGLDPLLVAAPAIGLLAGGIVALRILPLLAEALEAAISRGSGLVASLGSRQLARRPLRYTRSALLLMLAVSMGVFAVSYGATWSLSQRDQAAYQSGADVRIRPGSVNRLPVWARASAYASLPEVRAATPVERLTPGVVFVQAESANLLALDADKAAAIVRFRGDEASQSLADLMAPLREGRPEPTFLTLPDGSTFLRIAPSLDPATIHLFIQDPETLDFVERPIPPEEVRARAHAVVADVHGLLYQVQSSLVALPEWGDGLVLPLQASDPRGAAAAAEAAAELDGPVRVVEAGIDLWLPRFGEAQEGHFGVAGIAAGPAEGGPWTAVSTAPAGPWQARLGRGLQAPVPVSGPSENLTLELVGEGPTGSISGEGDRRPAARFSFIPASLADREEGIPAVVNRAFADGSDAVVGDTITASVDATRQRLRITGIVESFPTTDPARPLVIVDEPTLGLMRVVGSGATKAPTEWWLTAADGQTAALADALARAPLAGSELVTLAGRTQALSNDAVALGIVGALALGSLATGLFAVVGLAVSTAVSARQRRTEFALLRALGLSGRQLAGTLWLENASLVIVSLVAGTGLGLLIGWLVLPFVTVTQRAAAPVPPAIVEIPWDGVLILNAVSAGALAVAVIVIGGMLRRLGMGSILRMGED